MDKGWDNFNCVKDTSNSGEFLPSWRMYEEHQQLLNTLIANLYILQ